MKKTLLSLALLSAIPLSATADTAYKCITDTGVSYQQQPCKTGEQHTIEIKNTGPAPGLRLGEIAFDQQFQVEESARIKAKAEADQKAQEYALAERRHKELVNSRIVAGIVANPNVRVERIDLDTGTVSYSTRQDGRFRGR